MASAVFTCDIHYFMDVANKKLKMPFPLTSEMIKKEKGVIGVRHCVRPEFLNTKIYTKHF